MPLAINYPSWIHPEIFPNVPILSLLRWYGLMYVFAFGTAFFIMRHLMKKGVLNTKDYTATEDDLFSFFTTGIIFLLIGARVFSTLVYDTSGLYRQKPWLIFWPFNESGQFTGLAGMSYHGGFIGGLIGMIVWCLWKKRPVLQWIDAMVIAIAAGYTFGRLGNFLNGELFGRVTTMPWGMIFPNAQKFSASIPWVQEIATQAGIVIEEGQRLVNLPRHPSQLYEAFFEGIVLCAILWLCLKRKPFDGFLTSLYTIGYGFFRFIIEYFREPDIDLGYRIATVEDAPTYLNLSLLNISTGQIFCLGMIIAGVIAMIVFYILAKRKKVAEA